MDGTCQSSQLNSIVAIHCYCFQTPLSVNGQIHSDYQTMVPLYQVFSQIQVLAPRSEIPHTFSWVSSHPSAKYSLLFCFAIFAPNCECHKLTTAFTSLRTSECFHRSSQFEHFSHAGGVISDFHTLNTL